MILKYRVSLPGLKGFARVYEVKDTTTLYSLHKQMRADMDFPQDQVVLFKAFDADGNVAARYSVFQDFGLGTIDNVTAGMCHKRGEDKFIYFYDTTNVKSVIVTFEGESELRNNVLYPLLVETKWAPPRQPWCRKKAAPGRTRWDSPGSPVPPAHRFSEYAY